VNTGYYGRLGARPPLGLGVIPVIHKARVTVWSGRYGSGIPFLAYCPDEENSRQIRLLKRAALRSYRNDYGGFAEREEPPEPIDSIGRGGAI
jgi:hypothetical protein